MTENSAKKEIELLKLKYEYQIEQLKIENQKLQSEINFLKKEQAVLGGGTPIPTSTGRHSDIPVSTLSPDDLKKQIDLAVLEFWNTSDPRFNKVKKVISSLDDIINAVGRRGWRFIKFIIYKMIAYEDKTVHFTDIWNKEFMDYLGVKTTMVVVRIRNKCIEAGLIRFENQGTRLPGRYRLHFVLKDPGRN